MSQAAKDVQCPSCGANPGEPCISGQGSRKGQPRSRPHDARTALTPPRQPAPCGTYQGFQRHKRDGEESCDLCRIARNEWMAQYRRSHPADYEYGKRMTAARSRALWRLAKAHPDEFRAYTLEESKR